jgi:hypothetical protein
MNKADKAKTNSFSVPPLKYVSWTRKKFKLCLFSRRHREKSTISLIHSERLLVQSLSVVWGTRSARIENRVITHQTCHSLLSCRSWNWKSEGQESTLNSFDPILKEGFKMSQSFTALEVENYRALFKGADLDKSGKVRHQRLKNAPLPISLWWWHLREKNWFWGSSWFDELARFVFRNDFAS